MDIASSPILQIVVIVAAGLSAQWLAQVLRLPSIVFMLAAGVVVGPVLGWLDPDALLGDLLTPLVSLAVAIILLEGGLTLRWRELNSERSVVLRLISIGAIFTWLVGTMAALVFLDVSVGVAILLGSILVVSGPTVVGPLLRQIRPHGPAGQILRWESILIDPIGAMIATIVLEVIVAGTRESGTITGSPVIDVAAQVAAFIGIGTGIGLVAALALVPLLRWHVVPDRMQNSMVLAVALVAFVASNQLAAESGLLTVTVMGLLLANQKWTQVSHVLAFKENLVVLVLPVVFVVLAARLNPSELAGLGWPMVGVVAALVLVGRPIAVWASTIPSALEGRDRLLLAAVAPRGVVAALVASLFAHDLLDHGVPGAELLVPVTFVVIGAGAILYGLSAPVLAKRVGLAEVNPQGTLILGAGPVERRIASALVAAGADVLLAATSRAHEAEARIAGFRTHFGDLLSDTTPVDVDLKGIGRVLAITQNHEFNSLAALHFHEDFGRGNVYQLYPSADPDWSGTDAISGRPLFAEGASYEYLAGRLIDGDEIHTTAVTDTYSFDQLKEDRPDMLGLFVIRDGQIRVVTDHSFQAQPGDRITHLAAPRPAGEPERSSRAEA